MNYTPSLETGQLLAKAYSHIASAPYQVTARWVFYRLLQEGSLSTKGDYKRLLGYLSKARKGFYGPWRPDLLADDTRAALIRGGGFDSGQDWVDAVVEQTHCSLDRWSGQERYLEVWFEASAMQAQFRHYTNENVPLLAFHGDVSIPEKWKATKRLVDRWLELKVPITVLYYGDLDEKGMQIPISAHADVVAFSGSYFGSMIDSLYGGDREEAQRELDAFMDGFSFIRVGLNQSQVATYNIPENPERPGTYQWEGLDDAAAEELIGNVDNYIDGGRFDEVVEAEYLITEQFRDHLAALAVVE